ncbi:HAD-IA family hydrolase [Candidatus Dependentiae bacterium]|nr:HAD-IA family hydrolase [Candidatus Dependentiae bacterium]
MIKNIIFDLNGVVINADRTILKNPALVRQQSPFSLVDATVAFIKAQHGKRKLYVVSNFSKADEYAWLPTYEPELINLFDGIVVSAHVGYKKPDPRIFLHLIHEYTLVPAESLYIDDEALNVAVAKQLGMHGIFFYPGINLQAALEHLS